MMKILVSCCLLGFPTRYDGKANRADWVKELAREHTLIPVCPEQMGGLPTPRLPSEQQGDKVVNNAGKNVTREYLLGGKIALEIAEISGVHAAILKARSPSCGKDMIYDGTFTHTLTSSTGIAAKMLAEAGIEIFTEEEKDRCIDWLNAHT